MTAVKFIGDLDLTKLAVAPVRTDNNFKSARLTKSGGSNFSWGERVQFQLQRDEFEPSVLTWPLDAPMGQTVEEANKLVLQTTVSDPVVVQKLQAFEKWILDLAKQRSVEWFKEDLPIEVIRHKWSDWIKEVDGQPGTYSLKAKVFKPVPGNRYDYSDDSRPLPTAVFQQTSESEVKETDWRAMGKGSKCVLILSADRIWFTEKFGVGFRVEKVLLHPSERTTPMQAFALRNKYEVTARRDDGEAEKDREHHEDDEDHETAM